MMIAQQQTACDAFHAQQELLFSQRERALSFIRSTGGDWSIHEIAEAMGWDRSSASRCLNELVNSGKLVPKPKRKDRYSGITIRPVGLPAIQGRLSL